MHLVNKEKTYHEQQPKCTKKVRKLVNSDDLEKGDLLFFATSKAAKPNHVAIYVGDDEFIHSASSKGVSYAKTNNCYWEPRYIGAKRI